ncbi:MAG: outer membrane beta-barrel protein [Oligoflexia bacterium]|nr:outer membrane beta-barrel protein [Oligoflexia bacterium]
MALRVSLVLIGLTTLVVSSQSRPAWAADGAPPSPSASPAKDRSLPSDEEDFTSTPFTDYGEFNQEGDEEAETKFMQFGRLFGVSIGAGQDTALGNRGDLWQGGFPLIVGELHYWFDFHLALDMGFSYAPHYYNSPNTAEGYTSVSFTHVFLNIRYYFDTKDLSAPLSFASPYILGGFGEFNKTQNYSVSNSSDSDSTVGITAGAGLEFPIVVRSVYFDLETTISSASFKDTHNSPYTTVAPDLTGAFLTVTGGLMFTW